MENRMQSIVDRLEADDITIQLIEECAELIQACAKLIRAYKGSTPVSVSQVRANFVEEMADVSVAQAAAILGVMRPDEQETMFATESAKAERWQNRLNGGA